VERRDYELQNIDPIKVNTEAFNPKGEGNQFKTEVFKQQAVRRLRKEDIESDL